MIAKVRAFPIRPLKSVRPAGSAHERREAASKVVEALAALPSDSERMLVLAAASALYGREPDAEWFLRAARDPIVHSARCGRCGQLR